MKMLNINISCFILLHACGVSGFFHRTTLRTHNQDYLFACFDDGDITKESFDPVDNDCPSTTDSSLLTSNEYDVHWGDPARAYKTIPPSIMLAPSKIPGAGLGTYAKTFIKKYTWLGCYDGQIWSNDSDREDTHYAWIIFKQNNAAYEVDGIDISTSSWLRWVNCARNFKEQNVVDMQCKGRVYYITFKDIVPAEELLTFYGPAYAEDLGIDMEKYYTVK